MLLRRHRLFIASFAVPLSTIGCIGFASDGDEDLGETSQAVLTSNALTANALTANALTANALTANALTANALTANALTANALVAGALTNDPSARTVLKYIVGCALPAGTQLDVDLGGDTYHYEGQLGLAPSWGNAGGKCDAACRGWVSGCVLSRLNYLGMPVPLSVRGNRSELGAGGPEQQAYPQREATYYGDIFASPQVRLGCLSPGAGADPRVCGPSLASCAVTFVGPCDQACDVVRSDGSFPNCRDHVRNVYGKFSADARLFPGSVTVFLQ
ncbi:MAG: hypothetical protein QM820_24015 [Minicystis sp.]